MNIFIDRRFRKARIWSNIELRKFAHIFRGKVLNASGWKDIDKQGDFYRNYFTNSSEYWISNYKEEVKGMQGYENEFFLDLEETLAEEYIARYDVVFNHTTLEHIYDFKKAFHNLCALSKDIVIVVVPFLQEMHGHYGDYWRFSPLALIRLFEEEGMNVLYMNANDDIQSAVYIFAVASKHVDKKEYGIFNNSSNKISQFRSNEFFIGRRAIRNSFFYKVVKRINNIVNAKKGQ